MFKSIWIKTSCIGNHWVPQYHCGRSAVDERLSSVPTSKVGDVCSVHSGRYVRTYVPRETRDSIPYLRVDNVRPFSANVSDSDLVFINKNEKSLPPSCFVDADDVLIARTGTLGKACLAAASLKGAAISQHITRLQCKAGKGITEGIRAGYLCTFLNSELGRMQLVTGGSGSTRLELTHERLSDIRIPRVNSKVEGQIDDLVKDGASLMASAAKSFQRARAIYDNYLLQLKPTDSVTSSFWVMADELRDTWNPRRYSDHLRVWLENVKKRIPLVPLYVLAKITRGKGTRTSHYAESGIPFVRTSSIINSGIDPFPDHYCTERTYRQFGQAVQEYDLLMSIEGKIGQVALLTNEDRCAFKNHVVRIRLLSKEVSLEVFLMLSSILGQWQIESLTTVQATLPGLARRGRGILVPDTTKNCPDSQYKRTKTRAVRNVLNGISAREDAIRKLRKATQILENVLEGRCPAFHSV